MYGLLRVLAVVVFVTTAVKSSFRDNDINSHVILFLDDNYTR